MKEAIGGISIFQIVIAFIILFTGYICLSINYSKAYSIKNELLTIIKNQGGICSSGDGSSVLCKNFQYLVSNYLQETSYRSTGTCDDDWVGFDRNGELVDNGKSASFCVRGVNIANSGDQIPVGVYYEVEVFYQLDLPIINSLFHLSIKGETSRIYSPSECSESSLRYCWCSNTCSWGGE